MPLLRGGCDLVRVVMDYIENVGVDPVGGRASFNVKTEHITRVDHVLEVFFQGAVSLLDDIVRRA